MEENPFPDLKIADFEFLNYLEARQRCSRCRRSRKFFCYTCFIGLPSIADRLPKVKLPYKVHVIKHPGEVCGKSTAVHAAVLAPEEVTIYTYPDIPEYDSDTRVVLVYPGGNAVTMKDYVQLPNQGKQGTIGVIKPTECSDRENELGVNEPAYLEDSSGKSSPMSQRCLTAYVDAASEKSLDLENSRSCSIHLKNKTSDSYQNSAKMNSSREPLHESEARNRAGEACVSSHAEGSNFCGAIEALAKPRGTSGPIDVVVVIDCTWFQVHKISTDARLANLQRIEVMLHDTKFWRHQSDKPSTYLSTIEAIYYCAREYHESCSTVPYDGCYDNLLFFFCFFYHKIKNIAAKSGKKLKAYHQERRKKSKKE